MSEDRFIKGSELELGMRVQRFDNGIEMSHPMIVYADGVYFENPLYKDDDFKVIQEVAQR
jgi:hypothetical protein